ncbi:MAG: YbaN family protein [Acidimicrobiia bacterium]|nr:YbaN family protein [Acidimicrobiia bacterium]
MEDQIRVSRNPVARATYAVLGFVFLGIGIFGFFVPGPPGTVFLLVALYFFSMSNERMYRWMLTNKYFGQTLVDYKSGLGIPRRIKAIAVTCIVLAVGYSAGFVIETMWVRVSLVALGIYGIWFILSRPTTEVERARRAEATQAA